MSDFRSVEYQTLKEELASLTKRGYSINYSTLALAFGALTLGLAHQQEVWAHWRYIIILSPLIILPSGYKMMLELIKTIRRIASYLQIFYENAETKIFWETRLFVFRAKKNKYLPLNTFPAMAIALGWVSIIIALIDFWRLNHPLTYKYILLFPIAIIWWIYESLSIYSYEYSYKGSGPSENRYIEEWKNRYIEESKNNRNIYSEDILSKHVFANSAYKIDISTPTPAPTSAPIKTIILNIKDVDKTDTNAAKIIKNKRKEINEEIDNEIRFCFNNWPLLLKPITLILCFSSLCLSRIATILFLNRLVLIVKKEHAG